MKGYRIEQIPTARYDEWDRFAAQLPHGALFYSTGWLRMFGEPFIVAAIYEEKIVAGIATVAYKKFRVNGFHVLPFTPCNGFAANPQILNNADTLNELIGKLVHALPKTSVYDFTLTPGVQHIQPWTWEQFDVSVYCTHLISQQVKQDEYIQLISQGKKRDLGIAKKLLNEGILELRTGKDIIPDIKLLVTEASKNLGYRNPAEAFNAITARAEAYGIGIYHKEQGLLSGSILFEDAHVVYNLFNATKRIKDPKLGIVNVMTVYESVMYALRQNKSFDFEGSMLKGVEKFYRAMGGTPVPVYRCYKSKHLLLEMAKLFYKKVK